MRLNSPKRKQSDNVSTFKYFHRRRRDYEKAGDCEFDGFALLIGSSMAGAQEKFPTKPIEVVVPLPPEAPRCSGANGGQVCPQVF